MRICLEENFMEYTFLILLYRMDCPIATETTKTGLLVEACFVFVN
jgi:hypothetical protein